PRPVCDPHAVHHGDRDVRADQAGRQALHLPAHAGLPPAAGGDRGERRGRALATARGEGGGGARTASAPPPAQTAPVVPAGTGRGAPYPWEAITSGSTRAAGRPESWDGDVSRRRSAQERSATTR